MSSSLPPGTESSIGFYISPLSPDFGTESDSPFSTENKLSEVKFTYGRKPKIDYTKIQLSKDVKYVCQMFDQLSVYNQNPPYSPCKIKLDPFSRGTPSPIQGHSSADYSAANNDVYRYKGEESLLFESPRKDGGLANKTRKKDKTDMSSSKPTIKLPFRMRKL